WVRAVHEDPRAGRGTPPAPPLPLSERGPERVPVTRLTPDLDRHLERAARLVPQATRPPTRRVVDVERPAQVVVTAGQGDVAARFEEQRAPGRSPQPCGQPPPERRLLAVLGPGSIEREVEAQPASLLGRLDAHTAQPGHPRRSRLDDAHGAPQPARVPVGIEVVPVGEDAGDQTLGGAVRLTGTADL